ncbi:ABC transporter [Gracilibacillus boraciitolerans JCM 21714]|uniref:ABC transporter n=1 Tax=Gracilibacillus boraciitolerans JCM 21714 TaxID=1298598 RepID=W4VPK0_9BACI|nr:ABC transporter ATP-binding protein [Gracilibacillus boraciitolerans]GAE94674.1 ABC transporter [Gracilibacillus boraciitolerans JCM 21714]
MSQFKNPFLRVDNLYFNYEENIILDNLNLTVNRGEVLWIKGSNGVGKSTLLKILTGVIKIESLQMKFYDEQFKSMNDYKKSIAYIPDYPMLYDFLNGYDNLKLIMNLWKISNKTKYIDLANHLANELQIKDYLSQQVGNYSLGMKHKLFFIAMFAREPKILFMDEPFSAWDNKSYGIALEILQRYKEKGNSIVYISHLENIKMI